MKRVRTLLLAVGLGGCGNTQTTTGAGDAAAPREIGVPGADLGTFDAGVTPCGDNEPGCQQQGFGPPATTFPLQSDPSPDPNESDNGVNRDPSGWLGLSDSQTSFDFLWLANTNDWGTGSVSKVDSKRVREVARYFTVTCFSDPGGSRAACDGMNGCCSRDDWVRFQHRTSGLPDGPHQAVNLTSNSPSRTAVDFNGDVWVANRAFGVQSSVTRIANDPSECTERNGAPGIQTSSDVNGDGLIDTDCNANGLPDDVADVQKTPCTNGKPQEFYGLDDECILFTTNTNEPDKWGRPLALTPSGVDIGPSDAWAGSYQDGRFFRIDATGQTVAMTSVPVIPGSGPYGAVVDASGIVWVTQLGAGLTWFDSGHPASVGQVRDASGFRVSGYGITLDRDQNVWTGGWGDGNAYRYTPDRSSGTANLSRGFWTVVTNPGGAAGATGNGRGIAADARSQNAYFAWMARDGNNQNPGFVVRIDASAIALPSGQDRTVDGSAMPGQKVDGTDTIGAGLDREQNVWGISYGGSVATRIEVDSAGNMTPPDLAGGGAGSGCPVGGGDRCALQLAGHPEPNPYTYSDFTGFGLRNFTSPKGFYSYVQKGCPGNDTQWARITWDADVPVGTTLTVRARSGKAPTPDNTWGDWTPPFSTSPAVLDAVSGPLSPNPADHLQVEFDFATTNFHTTPKLKGFTIDFICLNTIG